MTDEDYIDSEEEYDERGPTPDDEEVEKINGHAERKDKDEEEDREFTEEGETLKPRKYKCSDMSVNLYKHYRNLLNKKIFILHMVND